MDPLVKLGPERRHLKRAKFEIANLVNEVVVTLERHMKDAGILANIDDIPGRIGRGNRVRNQSTVFQPVMVDLARSQLLQKLRDHRRQGSQTLTKTMGTRTGFGVEILQSGKKVAMEESLVIFRVQLVRQKIDLVVLGILERDDQDAKESQVVRVPDGEGVRPKTLNRSGDRCRIGRGTNLNTIGRQLEGGVTVNTNGSGRCSLPSQLRLRGSGRKNGSGVATAGEQGDPLQTVLTLEGGDGNAIVLILPSDLTLMKASEKVGVVSRGHFWDSRVDRGATVTFLSGVGGSGTAINVNMDNGARTTDISSIDSDEVAGSSRATKRVAGGWLDGTGIGKDGSMREIRVP
jgi:hypothetical protein